MNIIVDFKNIILALRNERGFSQEQLAKVLHVSKSTVAMWETGQRLPSVEKYEEIANRINQDIDRGVTILEGMGWYSKQPKKVICVLAKRNESINIFRIVKSIDPNAFISQSNVVGVYGEGFDKIKA